MDLARAVYSRDLKITAMRALDAGSTTGEIARKYQLSPKLLERWRGEWRAKGESAFPGIGRHADPPALDDARRIAELERKIGQLTMENDKLQAPAERSEAPGAVRARAPFPQNPCHQRILARFRSKRFDHRVAGDGVRQRAPHPRISRVG